MRNIAALILILFTSSVFAVSSELVAIVNDHPITKYEFENRKNMIVTLNNVDLSDSLTELKLDSEILNGLIEEELLAQHAKSVGAEVDKAELDQAIANIEARNNMKKGGMKDLLQEKGIGFETFRKQIKGEITKQNVVNELSNEVSISQNELDMALVNSGDKDFNIEAWVLSSKGDSDKLMNQMKGLKKQFISCDKVNGKLYEKFADGEKFDRKLSELPIRTKSVVSDTKAGTSSQIYIEDEKFKFVFVCKKDRVISDDDLSKVTHFLSNKKMSKKAVKFFKDLRAKAYIQTFGTNK